MTDRAFTPPRFIARATGPAGLCARWSVWDHDNSRFVAGSPFRTKRGAERKADKMNALDLKRKSRESATRVQKLRSLNYAGDPAPIRQYKD